MVATPRASGGRRPEALARDLQSLLAHVRDATGPRVYLVGGAVRDLWRGEAPRDLDLVCDGDVAAVAGRLAAALKGHAFVLDQERSQHRVVLDGAIVPEIDISPLQGDIEADLRARDFTVNAIGAPLLADGVLGDAIDPTRGLRDLQQRLLRMTGEAALVEDPLRLLRAVRLNAELDFGIEASTAEAIRRHAALLARSAAERQRDELTRVLSTHRSAQAFRLMDSLGLLEHVMPELLPARGVSQPPAHHYYDVFDHSIEALAGLDAILSNEEELDRWHYDLRAAFRVGMAGYELDEYLDGRAGGQSRRVLLKLAGVLHDVAKPETRTVEPDGRVRFLGHSELGATRSELICRRLRFGTREARFVARLVDDHLRPTQLSPQHGSAPSRRALYRFFRDLEHAAPACLILYLADGAAAAGPRLTLERWQRMVSFVAFVLAEHARLQQQVPPAKKLIAGNDLIDALGIEPGPLLGRLLKAVEEAAGGGDIETPEEAIGLARRLLADADAEAPR